MPGNRWSLETSRQPAIRLVAMEAAQAAALFVALLPLFLSITALTIETPPAAASLRTTPTCLGPT
ncbi:hypothetical protein [Azohydromonas caseinilytica]|uniref:Uncharacterized protein n=1 Tax=Azohydromonas caseinilytica TaxID=2728836 RepID=A0A848FIX4_9BURK|nr:hypothetical protein [Azohydromonas caseinilytica]NML19086.1 hypothetical protein [Azohydromonas caseinilytica]